MPFLTRDELCRLFGLEKDQVRVLARRVGGGFGGKQEMLTEDIVALAVLRTGRPVQLELTREEEFTAATTRHPMAVTVRVGRDPGRHADRRCADVRRRHRRVRQPRARGAVPRVEEAVTAYRCPNKRVDARAVYTNTVPAGAFRGYGLSQTVFAVESAIDELARLLGIDPADFRRRNLIRPGERPTTPAARQRTWRPPASARSSASTWWRRPWRSGRGRAPRRHRVADGNRDRGDDARHDPARRAPGAGPDRGATGRRVRSVRGDGGVRERDHDRAPAARRGRAGLRARARSRSSPPTPTAAGTTPGRTGRRASWSRARRRCGPRGRWRR